MSGLGDLAPVLLSSLVIAFVAAFSLVPLVRRVPYSEDGGSLAESPQDQRLHLYRQVVELELDRDTGKLSTEDYERLSGDLLGRAAGLLPVTDDSSADIDEALEREIAAARRSRGVTAPGPPRAAGAERTRS